MEFIVQILVYGFVAAAFLFFMGYSVSIMGWLAYRK